MCVWETEREIECVCERESVRECVILRKRGIEGGIRVALICFDLWVTSNKQPCPIGTKLVRKKLWNRKKSSKCVFFVITGTRWNKPTSVSIIKKRLKLLDCLFYASGICVCKSCTKSVDKIEPQCQFHQYLTSRFLYESFLPACSFSKTRIRTNITEQINFFRTNLFEQIFFLAVNHLRTSGTSTSGATYMHSYIRSTVWVCGVCVCVCVCVCVRREREGICAIFCMCVRM